MSKSANSIMVQVRIRITAKNYFFTDTMVFEITDTKIADTIASVIFDIFVQKAEKWAFA